ncbi:olfactory receptor 51G2-like [Pseudonaja textilis]|uniref:olfactory receptor 51G2-like n=1 Tax=Pseudonaja textilis TaxID=8673 RepID=UPI000EA997E8|nr:olfactory receptor 51G2-like [Pseudonaja textilis]
MASAPLPNVSLAVFALGGFPGLETAYGWIGTTIFCVYLVAVLGNSSILYIIWVEPSLHRPMYQFLAMLAATDLGLCAITLPTVLGVLWFRLRQISSRACIAQAFFLHAFALMESAVLFAMAVDRFVAIRYPLRYSELLSTPRVLRIGLALFLRSTLTLLPAFFFLARFPYCPHPRLSHSYCLHQDLIRSACSDTTFNNFYVLVLIFLSMGSDLLFILLSYSLILRALLGMASSGLSPIKALSTCASHLCAVLVFCAPALGLSIIHRFGQHAPPLVYALMGNVYILFPPLMNPVLYSLKTKEISGRLLQMLRSLWKV